MSTIALTYGRFIPPTIAHAKVFNELYDYSNWHKCDSSIFVSHSHDKKKNPLSIDRKLYYLNSFFPHLNFIPTTKESPTIFNVLTKLNKSYSDIVLFVGSDRYDAFEQDLNYYNNNLYYFNSIKLITIGDIRDDNSSDIIKSCSGTLVRNLAKLKDQSSFNQYLPYANNDLHNELFNELSQ